MKNRMSVDQLLKINMIMKRLNELNNCDESINSIKVEYNDGMKIEFHRMRVEAQ